MARSAVQTTDELHDTVRQIVLQELEIDPEELAGSASFEEEYGADSLALLAVIARFEKELGIAVPSDDMVRMTTFDNVLALVDERWAQRQVDGA